MKNINIIRMSAISEFAPLFQADYEQMLTKKNKIINAVKDPIKQIELSLLIDAILLDIPLYPATNGSMIVKNMKLEFTISKEEYDASLNEFVFNFNNDEFKQVFNSVKEMIWQCI